MYNKKVSTNNLVLKKDYINLIRWSCILEVFTNFYFIRMIVIYLLSQDVVPWVAVSIPIVLDFSNLVARSFKPFIKFAIKVDYKKYHIFHLISFLTLTYIISKCRTIFPIYIFTIIAGLLTGIKHTSVNKLNTQNEEYEPYCFIEEERAQVIGGTLGLIASQFIYDLSPKLYIAGYIVLIIVGTALSIFLKEIPAEDIMSEINEHNHLDNKSKNDTILITSLFGIFAGLWCVGLGGFEELAPLISNKIGYLEAVYTTLEIILLFIISGSLIKKIKEKKKLLLAETIMACTDVFCLFIASLTLSWEGLLVAYVVMGITGTLGDPLWGSIMSAYSANDRTKYVLVNKVYFIIRAIFMIITWFVCRECVIKGIESFKYLALILIFLMIILYIISNKINKRVFGTSI